jgi:hypothetical protein
LKVSAGMDEVISLPSFFEQLKHQLQISC